MSADRAVHIDYIDYITTAHAAALSLYQKRKNSRKAQTVFWGPLVGSVFWGLPLASTIIAYV
jgi:hypothetical protein